MIGHDALKSLHRLHNPQSRQSRYQRRVLPKPKKILINNYSYSAVLEKSTYFETPRILVEEFFDSGSLIRVYLELTTRIDFKTIELWAQTFLLAAIANFSTAAFSSSSFEALFLSIRLSINTFFLNDFVYLL